MYIYNYIYTGNHHVSLKKKRFLQIPPLHAITGVSDCVGGPPTGVQPHHGHAAFSMTSDPSGTNFGSAEATGGIVILDLKSSTTRSGKQWFPYIGKGPRKNLAGFA